MRDASNEGPNRRTVIAGAAAASLAWTVPVVLSGSPAAAQASGCSLLEVTSTPVCTSDPALPYAVDISVSVVGCAGSYSVEIIQEGPAFVGCFPLPPGGGPLVRISSPIPAIGVTLTFNLRSGVPCAGAVIDSTDLVVSTPPSGCDIAGAPVDGVPADAGVPTATF